MDIFLIDFMTLDGVVQAPGGPDEDTDGGFAHGGWSHPYFDPEVMGPVVGGMMERTDALLYGRRTWEGMAAAWPGRAGDPFADAMNAAPKYVLSTTLTAEKAAATWNGTQLLDGIDAVRELRAQPGKGVQVWGSPSLSRQLIEADLVDEYILFLEPLMVGGGKRFFPEDGSKRPLELLSAVPAATGTIVCTYRPVRD
jgi:dihydrofolate reductase